METITIIFTGLIALVPSSEKNELIALLVNHADHTPRIVVRHTNGICRLENEAFDALLPAAGQLIQKPPPEVPKTMKMEWFKNTSGVSYGPISEDLLAFPLKDRDKVIGRVRLANVIDIEWERHKPKAKWRFSTGRKAGRRIVLADKVIITVPFEGQQIGVRLGDRTLSCDGLIPKEITVFNEPSLCKWCGRKAAHCPQENGLCDKRRIIHLGHFFGLSDTSGPGQLPRPTTTTDVCRGCRTGIPGTKPVRCPGAQFEASDLPKWEWRSSP